MLLSKFVFSVPVISVCAAAIEHRIAITAHVQNFVHSVQMDTKVSSHIQELHTQGFSPIWAEAIAGEGVILGDHGIGRRIVRIFVIPAGNGSNGIRRYIIGGNIRDASDIRETHDFITTSGAIAAAHPGPASAISRHGIIAPPLPGALGNQVTLEPLIDAIRTRNHFAIWEIILGGRIASNDIRIAMEINGIRCIPPPPGFPESSIWLAATTLAIR